MIVDLPDTTTNAISSRLVALQNGGGALAIGRVLTLIVVSDEFAVDHAVSVAVGASRESPCRVLVIARGNKRGGSRLDASIRVGTDAGAGEVIVLRLYGAVASHGESLVVPLLLPDAPIVVWWPGVVPEDPAHDPIGRMAQRRITDVSQAKNPIRALTQLARRSTPGDTDLAWSRITRWRALLAAALDQPPHDQVTRAVVTGAPDSPSVELMAAWLALTLECPVTRRKTAPDTGLAGVTLVRDAGKVSLDRPAGGVGTLIQPGQPVRRVAMAPGSDVECLTEELRRLDPDELFAEVLGDGLPALSRAGRRAGSRA